MCTWISWTREIRNFEQGVLCFRPRALKPLLFLSVGRRSMGEQHFGEPELDGATNLDKSS